MHLELPVGVGPHQKPFERRGAGALNLHVHAVEMLDAVVSRILRAHVNVPFGANHSLLEHERPLGPDQDAAGRSLDIAREPHRHVDAQADRVGEGQLDLTELAARPRMRTPGIILCRGPTTATVSLAAKSVS